MPSCKYTIFISDYQTDPSTSLGMTEETSLRMTAGRVEKYMITV